VRAKDARAKHAFRYATARRRPSFFTRRKHAMRGKSWSVRGAGKVQCGGERYAARGSAAAIAASVHHLSTISRYIFAVRNAHESLIPTLTPRQQQRRRRLCLCERGN